jgi:hypothetical protein
MAARIANPFAGFVKVPVVTKTPPVAPTFCMAFGELANRGGPDLLDKPVLRLHEDETFAKQDKIVAAVTPGGRLFDEIPLSSIYLRNSVHERSAAEPPNALQSGEFRGLGGHG